MSWCSDCGLLVQNSYMAAGSGRLVRGFFFWLWTKSGNWIGSRRKNTGVLLPTRSQLPCEV